jgi:hypothetical protein
VSKRLHCWVHAMVLRCCQPLCCAAAQQLTASSSAAGALLPWHVPAPAARVWLHQLCTRTCEAESSAVGKLVS